MERYNFDLSPVASTPEGLLLLRMLQLEMRAYIESRDLKSPQEASSFFRSSWFYFICDNLDLDDEVVIETLQQQKRRQHGRWEKRRFGSGITEGDSSNINSSQVA